MPVIDADTHVDETEETWSYLEGDDARFRPITVTQDIPGGSGELPKGYNRYWLIDGQLRVRRIRDDERTGTVQATRELQDVGARLEHMDALGVDIQVMYPTLFLMQVSGKPDVEAALCRSYNRWMADKWKQGGGRLRWVAPLPLLSMDMAVEELNFVKEHGACGVLKKGRECDNRLASDPYFFPLYEEASRLDVPICVHLGTGDPELRDAAPDGIAGMLSLTLPVLDAFHALIIRGVPQKFPELRFGFIEATASWVPYLFTELRRGHQRRPNTQLEGFELSQDLLRENRFYVTCDTFDDLGQVTKLCGDDNFIIGSDYGHADMSAEIDALRILQEHAAQQHVEKATVDKILSDNARALYGLD
jgi:uncharacterized protein